MLEGKKEGLSQCPSSLVSFEAQILVSVCIIIITNLLIWLLLEHHLRFKYNLLLLLEHQKSLCSDRVNWYKEVVKALKLLYLIGKP